MESKVCKTCLQIKPLSEFYQKERKIKAGTKIYIDGSCQDCERAKKNKYNKENRERIRERNKELYSLDPERYIKYSLKYQKNNRETINNWRRKKLRADPRYKLAEVLRRRIRFAVKGFVKSADSESLVGCSWEELKSHLESLFQEGMSWENHGQKGWHVDHITPLSSGKTLEEIEKLCHYTNLQPLWWHENLSKGAKIRTDSE